MAYYYLGDFEKALTYYQQGLNVTGLKSKFTAPLVYWSYLSVPAGPRGHTRNQGAAPAGGR